MTVKSADALKTDNSAEALETDVSTTERPLDLNSIQTEAIRLFQIGGMSLGFISTLGKLAAAELVASAVVFPKLLGVGFLLLPVVYIAWLSLCALIAYCAVLLFEALIAGFVVFTALQFLLIAMAGFWARAQAQQIGFSETKMQGKQFFEMMKNEFASQKDPTD